MKAILRPAYLAPFAGWLVLAVAALGFVATAVTGIVLIAVVIAAVHHAEVVAHRVGEPFGTLILAVSVTVIEAGLIMSLMLADPGATAALARDTVFAATMIILNLLIGLCLVVDGLHDKDRARFTRTGATAALATLATMTTLTMVLPNFTSAVLGPYFSATQLAFVASFAFILYLVFVFVQTVANRDYFLPKGPQQGDEHVHADPPPAAVAWQSFAALLACLGAVVLLGKSLSKPLEMFVKAVGAPQALVGIAIAGIVLLPEALAAVRAAHAHRLQTSFNLALGSALATIGLTIPVVAIASIAMPLPIALGLDAKSTILLALSLFVAALSLSRGRTTVLHGAVHLVIFGAYIVLTVLP